MQFEFYGEKVMKFVKTKSCRLTFLRSSRGFSLVEVVVALAVALVLVAISIPSVLGTYNQYRLGVQATLIANELDQLRMVAVRKNTTITLLSTTTSTTPPNTVIFVDANKSGALDINDPQVFLPADMQISNSGTPPAGMPDSSSMGSNYTSAVKLPSGGISFTSNGTISGGAGPYFIVIGYTASTQYGFRAITVTPMGEIKVWTASSGGSWTAAS